MGELRSAWEANAAAWIAWAREPGHDSYWRFHRDLFLELVPPPAGRTLDVGCGEGRLARDLAALGHDVAGIDASPTLLAAAPRDVRRGARRQRAPDRAASRAAATRVRVRPGAQPALAQDPALPAPPGGQACERLTPHERVTESCSCLTPGHVPRGQVRQTAARFTVPRGRVDSGDEVVTFAVTKSRR